MARWQRFRSTHVARGKGWRSHFFSGKVILADVDPGHVEAGAEELRRSPVAGGFISSEP